MHMYNNYAYCLWYNLGAKEIQSAPEYCNDDNEMKLSGSK